MPPNIFKIRPEQFNFLFFEHLGQKLKIGGGKKNKNKSKCDTLIRNVHTLQHLIHYKYHLLKMSINQQMNRFSSIVLYNIFHSHLKS